MLHSAVCKQIYQFRVKQLACIRIIFTTIFECTLNLNRNFV